MAPEVAKTTIDALLEIADRLEKVAVKVDQAATVAEATDYRRRTSMTKSTIAEAVAMVLRRHGELDGLYRNRRR